MDSVRQWYEVFNNPMDTEALGHRRMAACAQPLERRDDELVLDDRVALIMIIIQADQWLALQPIMSIYACSLIFGMSIHKLAPKETLNSRGHHLSV